jgi:hypothetical protein
MMSSNAVPAPKVTNYQGNSKVAQENAAAEAEAETERVPAKKIEGVEVVKAKKPLGRRIRESFGGDDLKTVGKMLLVTVILPSAKDLLMDVVKEGGHRMIYGESSGRVGSSPSIVGSGSRIRTTNYSTMSQSPLVVPKQQGITTLNSHERAMFDFSSLVFPEQNMALEVLERLNDAITEFGIVTVADFYDFIGQTGNGFTDQKHGWNVQAFQGAEVRRVRGGFILNLPTPREIG